MSGKIIYFTRFMPTCDSGGGSRRMMQILEVLKRLNCQCEVVSTQRKDRLSMEVFKRIEANMKKAYYQSLSLDNEYKLWSEKRRKGVCCLREISKEWSRSIEEIPRLKLTILDDPIYFTPLLETLRQCSVPKMAVCHNLETLAPTQVGRDPNWSLFNKEIDSLAQCDMVITISREETFLTHSLGIKKTVFFPYYPVDPILNRLLQIREKRKKAKKKGILLLGNAINLQTRQGMGKVISFWQSPRLFREEGKLIVAGYSTELYLKKDYNSSAVEYLGTLSNNKLDRLLCTVRACLCYQDKGAGALTRIFEMLIAGVPVLANSHAARSYYNMNGVIEFRDLNDLERALKQIDMLEGQTPIPPEPNSSYLISEIKKIMEH